MSPLVGPRVSQLKKVFASFFKKKHFLSWREAAKNAADAQRNACRQKLSCRT
jgi:hypothetical protein